MRSCSYEGLHEPAFGHPVPDAASLLVPALGLVAATHPLTLRTIEVVRHALEQDGRLSRKLGTGMAGDDIVDASEVTRHG